MEDLEEFGSLREAVQVFQGRLENTGGHTPLVDTPELSLYLKREDAGGPGVWRFLTAGPRGGVRVE
jgi:hypothetical protein